jgi:hypothetical protein
MCGVVEQEQAVGQGMPLLSVGVRENLVWDFVAVKRCLFPMLHELLGLGNDLISNFWKCVEEGAKLLEPDKIEARNVLLLAEIQLETQKQQLMNAILIWRPLLSSKCH